MEEALAETILGLQGHGRLRGLRKENAYRRYLNVPYALPPTGSRRWQKPSPLPSDFIYGHDSQPHDCTKFGGFCLQPSYIIDGKDFSAVEGSQPSEDCLLLNIWVPDAQPEANKKWPVYVWLHGGWLQMGNPCHTERSDPRDLITSEGGNLQAIVVAVGYRLNIFGFLAGDGVSGNFGFWDQRLALEWIQQYIGYFGGDRQRATLGGLSAGAYSTHTQLQYELLNSTKSEPLFQNVFFCSNAISVEPKRQSEANEQLQDIFQVFGIAQDLPAAEKLEQLRQVPADTLIERMPEFRLHTFRAVIDEEFIHGDMMTRLSNGDLATAFKARGMRVLIGETENEQCLYSLTNPPNSFDALPLALENYYSATVCGRILEEYDYKNTKLEANELFGIITSDFQVRIPIRLFCQVLVDGGVPLSNIMRYRSAFRAACVDTLYSPYMGVTHGVDLCTWWFLARYGYTPEEEASTKDFLRRSLVALVQGEPFESGCTSIKQYLKHNADGSIRVTDDQDWDRLMAISKVL